MGLHMLLSLTGTDGDERPASGPTDRPGEWVTAGVSTAIRLDLKWQWSVEMLDHRAECPLEFSSSNIASYSHCDESFTLPSSPFVFPQSPLPPSPQWGTGPWW